MSVTALHQPWYLGERAESLAVIRLTDNPDVEVMSRQEKDTGLEILARVCENGKLRGRFFGIEVRAALSQPAHWQASPVQAYTLDERELLSLRDVPFPVCLWLFTVDDDRGQWGWIRKPAVGNEDGRHLTLQEQIPLFELTTEAVNMIVADVRHWYDPQERS